MLNLCVVFLIGAALATTKPDTTPRLIVDGREFSPPYRLQVVQGALRNFGQDLSAPRLAAPPVRPTQLSQAQQERFDFHKQIHARMQQVDPLTPSGLRQILEFCQASPLVDSVWIHSSGILSVRWKGDTYPQILNLTAGTPKSFDQAAHLDKRARAIQRYLDSGGMVVTSGSTTVYIPRHRISEARQQIAQIRQGHDLPLKESLVPKKLFSSLRNQK